MNNEYDMIDMVDGENDPEVLGHLNVSWLNPHQESEDMDSPDHDDIVGWNEDISWEDNDDDVDMYDGYDDWQSESEYMDYEPSPYDGTYSEE